MADKKYTLDKLMRVYSQTEFHGTKVYLRTLSAKYDELRSQAALASAARERNVLRDKESAEYQLHIAPLADEPIEDLKSLVSSYERTRLRRLSQSEIVDDREPPLPDDATITDAVDRELEEEKIAEETRRRRDEWVEKKLADFTKLHLDGYQDDDKFVEPEWGEEEIRREARKRHSSALVDRAYVDGYDRASIYYGCYKDKKCKQPFFDDIEEVDDCHPAFKQHLLATYYELDRFGLNMDALKN